MAEPAKKLVPRAVVGTRVEGCLILADHPDDLDLHEGHAPPHGPRTVVSRFDGIRAIIVETVPAYTFWAWSSSSGHSYAAPSEGGYLMVHAKGEWSRETLSSTTENISSMWGWPGQSATEDLVFVSAESKVFLREKGRWHSLPIPGEPGTLYGVHGSGPNEVYIGSDEGFLLWDGRALSEVEGPRGDTAESVLVMADSIFAGDVYLSRWTQTDGWQRATDRKEKVASLYAMHGKIYVGTYDRGVTELIDGKTVPLTPPFSCVALYGVGDAVFGFGDGLCYFSRGGPWEEVSLPPAP
jgi:hypothetical protein